MYPLSFDTGLTSATLRSGWARGSRMATLTLWTKITLWRVQHVTSLWYKKSEYLLALALRTYHWSFGTCSTICAHGSLRTQNIISYIGLTILSFHNDSALTGWSLCDVQILINESLPWGQQVQVSPGVLSLPFVPEDPPDLGHLWGQVAPVVYNHSCKLLNSNSLCFTSETDTFTSNI